MAKTSMVVVPTAVFLLMVVLLGALNGCVSSRGLEAAQRESVQYVRKVDYTRTPEMTRLAERAREVGNEIYPKVLGILTTNASGLPHQFDIVFRRRIDAANHGGAAIGQTIYLPGDALAKHPDVLDLTLVHEMAHVAEDYKWFNGLNIPSYWREGIAAYVQYKLGYTQGVQCPQCSAEYSHYKDGYWCAGAFLLYLDATYGTNVVQSLNTTLRNGSYSERYFSRVTGKRLERLWEDFQNTAAFTPLAAEANQLRQAIGYRKENSTNFIRQCEAYIRQQPGGELTLEAREFLKGRMMHGRQPGWKDEPGQMSFGLSNPAHLPVYPAFRTFHGQKYGDPSILHYTVSRSSKESAWELRHAWRTAIAGKTVEEYPIP